MRQATMRIFIAIIILAISAAWIDLPNNPGIHLEFGGFKLDRELRIHEGLDLQGGMQVMLEANVPPGKSVTRDAMIAAKDIVENRVNGLGVSEPLIQLVGDKRIIVELPGIKDPERAIRVFGETGLLEFIDAGDTFLSDGTVVTTTLGGPGMVGISPEAAATPAAPAPTPTPPASPVPATPTAAAPITSTTPLTGTVGTTPETPKTEKVYKTILTGDQLQSAKVGFDELGRPEIDFTFKDQGAKIFADYTTANVGKFLAITMDKRVISSAVIRTPITGGSGRITSERGFPLAEAQSIVIQLKYGALPIPLKVVQSISVGPTLGQDSIHRSMIAGAIGLAIVIAFMIIHYRLPGLLASLALFIYALLAFALFKLIPVVLTLAGIAGFILSIGMAVDANILIFERMREELRWGRTLGAAIEAGFARAWTSIRDSNVSTIITCIILFWFGEHYGASIIKGFALTLAIGVLVSMFTAIIVTRTFLRVAQRMLGMGEESAQQPHLRRLLGLPGGMTK
ncbi:MAG: protein translocase subunit SecD [Chloroflexi bacterium]|nr:protein translocase subunit SecD [Chloroflexota bacterium]MCL5075017.1 protein translocase subunit SecD [Chloroflexota bacterium]